MESESLLLCMYILSQALFGSKRLSISLFQKYSQIWVSQDTYIYWPAACVNSNLAVRVWIAVKLQQPLNTRLRSWGCAMICLEACDVFEGSVFTVTVASLVWLLPELKLAW